ncbi:MAG: O-methyltransferase [Polyangiales bacterium]
MADTTSRAGARYANEAILEFVERVHAPHDAALTRAFDAPAVHGMPAIQVAPSEGKLLGLILRLASARKVVEVGTLAGYSALRMARALPEGGKLYSLELDPKHAQVARDNLAAAGLSHKVEVRVGEGAAVLSELSALAPFDAVFLDADKAGYPVYAAWAAEHLRPGGVLLADNSYYFGQLLADDPSAAAMRRFHELTAERFDSVCIPTPDGLVLGIKR